LQQDPGFVTSRGGHGGGETWGKMGKEVYGRQEKREREAGFSKVAGSGRNRKNSMKNE